MRAYYYLLLFLLSFSFSNCRKYSAFSKVDDTTINEDVKEQALKFSDSAYGYIKNFIVSYQNTCSNYGVNSRFYDSLPFMDLKKISAEFYYSTKRETIIYIYNDSKNVFSIKGSDLPAQVQFSYPENRYSWEPNLYEEYDSLKTYFTFKSCSDCFIVSRKLSNGKEGFLWSYSTKFITIREPNEPIYIRGGEFQAYEPPGVLVTDKILDPKGIMMFVNSTTYLSGNTLKGVWLGNYLASKDIQTLYFNSEYFREVLANDKLAPIAKEMLEKKARSEIDATFKYDSSDFVQDEMSLKSRIDSFAIKLSPNDIFNNVRYQIRPGVLLYFYSSYLGYTWQWSIINLIAILIVFTFQYFKLFDKDWGPWIKISVFISALGWVNKRCFESMPLGMSVRYWIIPLLILLIAYSILFIYKRR